MALSSKDANVIETLIACEGFDEAMRSDEALDIKEPKFKQLLKNLLKAEQEMHAYLVSCGVQVEDED